MSVQTDTLADFLLARIAEDEAVAQAAVASPWEAVTDDHGRGRSREHSVWSGDMHGSYVAEWIAARVDADHIARWDPARVLAECETKRRIVDNARAARRAMGEAPLDQILSAQDGPAAAYWRGLDYALRLLALSYANRAGYRAEWRP